jgi:hypothetical protein
VLRSYSAPHGMRQSGQVEGCSLRSLGSIDAIGATREPHRAVRQATEMVKGGFWGLKNDLSGGMVCPTRGQTFLVSRACLWVHQSGCEGSPCLSRV